MFLKLVPAMETFVYQPGKKFRGYLHTATRNAMVDLSKQLGREPRAMGGDVQDALLQREGNVTSGGGWRTSSTFELVEPAEEQIRNRVKDEWRYAAYVEVDRNGRPPAEVARELGVRARAGAFGLV